MPAPKIRTQYDQLGDIARTFGEQAQAWQQTLRSVTQTMEVLQNGDWIGAGATAFYKEMGAEVLPALRRLAEAFSAAQRVTTQINQVLKRAEEEAAAVFRTTPGQGVAGTDGGAGTTLTEKPKATGTGSGTGSGGGGTTARSGASTSKGRLASTAAVLDGTISLKKAPANISLPKTLDKGMRDAWGDSFPGGHEQEQGGLFVRTPDGKYKWLRGSPGDDGSWPPNYEDLGDNTLLGLGHTHPYDATTFASFSDTDISFLFSNEAGAERMMMVQSGKHQYVIARTKEFDAMLATKTPREVRTMIKEMQKLYDKTMTQAEDKGQDFENQIDAAVKAVSDKYQLVYYTGQTGNLQKR